MLVEKTSVVKKIGENFRNFEGSYGMQYVHLVTFENGDSGQYFAQTPKCVKFIEGEQYLYSMEEKTNQGETYMKVKPVEHMPKNGAKSNSSGYQKFDERSELCTTVRSSSMQAMEAIRAGVEKLENYEALADRVLKWQKKNSNL